MTKSQTIPEALRKLCLSLPEAEQVSCHGKPDFKVTGKSFAMLNINHHGDMRVGLWLHSADGAQSHYTELNPDVYFIPPYLGPKGWLGLDLNKTDDWHEVVMHVRQAYENVAPQHLKERIDEAIRVSPPTQKMSAQDINPMLADKPQEILAKLAKLCDRLPETTATTQFGNPVFKAGKKTFVGLQYSGKRLKMQLWTGLELQSLLISDERFSIPSYIGHNGWVSLDIEDWINWEEVEALLVDSYRHFALKRMLNAM